MSDEAKRIVQGIDTLRGAFMSRGAIPVADAIRDLGRAADFIEDLSEELERVRRERDAAIDDIELGVCCETCKHDNDDDEERFCHGCIRATCRGNWEWRGVRDDG